MLFKCMNMPSLCFSFLPFPVLSMDLWIKARNLSKRFLPYVGRAVSSSIDSDLELFLGAEELASAFPVCFPRCSCFLITPFHWVPVLMNCGALNLVSSHSCSISVSRFFFLVFFFFLLALVGTKGEKYILYKYNFVTILCYFIWYWILYMVI